MSSSFPSTILCQNRRLLTLPDDRNKVMKFLEQFLCHDALCPSKNQKNNESAKVGRI